MQQIESALIAASFKVEVDWNVSLLLSQHLEVAIVFSCPATVVVESTDIRFSCDETIVDDSFDWLPIDASIVSGCVVGLGCS